MEAACETYRKGSTSDIVGLGWGEMKTLRDTFLAPGGKKGAESVLKVSKLIRSAAEEDGSNMRWVWHYFCSGLTSRLPRGCCRAGC